MDPIVLDKRGAVILGKRLGLPTSTLQAINQAKYPTQTLFQYWQRDGPEDQQNVSFIIQKMREQPPMTGPAKILEDVNHI